MPLAKNLIKAAGNATQANYIEDVFSTYLYAGNDGPQTITNNIDLSTKGGLVWTKSRTNAAGHRLSDTARGIYETLFTNTTDAQVNDNTFLTAFNSNGFTLGSTNNASGQNYASWTFRKQPKFFDVVTYTGDNSSSHTVSHSLTSQPGFIIIKKTSGTDDWMVAASDGAGNYKMLQLNNTSAQFASQTQSTIASTTEINIGWLSTNWQDVNVSGATYVMYIYASNAGGFGLTGTDNVISCGSFTTDGSGNASVNLGYEPQYVLYKKSSAVGQWYIEDTMRGLYAPSQVGTTLIANLSNAEGAGNGSIWLNSTGFTVNPAMNLGTSTTCIYIAIRRGPMKVPTDGTKVFSPNVSAASQGTKITTNFPVDMQWSFYRAGGFSVRVDDRLRGVNTTTTSGTISTPYLQTASTSAETSYTGDTLGWDNTGFQMPNGWAGNAMSFNNFQRAPSFFDEVCYTGTGTFTTPFTHNLTVTPELVIVKARTTTGQMNWYVGQYGVNKYGQLTTAAFNPDLSTYAPVTSTTFVPLLDNSGINYVAYLFATCAGVSKVGSYTGTGTTQQVDCGFAAGARFVLVKATSTTGDWIVVDTARGLVSGNDPTLLLNSTAAEVTTNDWFDPYSAGFELSSAGGNLANTNGVSYIFFAVA